MHSLVGSAPCYFFLLTRQPPRSPLFPYTTLFRSTLAGPRSGFILCKEEHAQAIDRAIFPGLQGGPLEHTIAAKATCFRIAATQAFHDYQVQIRKNADMLAATLMRGGLDILTGGTDTHLMQIDLRNSE